MLTICSPARPLESEHATRDDDGLGGVTGVDGVGQVPLGDVAGVAEVGLDVAEVERRRSVDRLEGPRERVDAGHVVTESVGDLDRRVVIDVDAVLGQLGLDEGDAVRGARADVHLDDGRRALDEFVGLGADDRQDERHVRRRVVHPGEHVGDLVGEERLRVAHDDHATIDEERRRVERLDHARRDRLSPGCRDVLRGEVLEREGGIEFA